MEDILTDQDPGNQQRQKALKTSSEWSVLTPSCVYRTNNKIHNLSSLSSTLLINNPLIKRKMTPFANDTNKGIQFNANFLDNVSHFFGYASHSPIINKAWNGVVLI